MLLQHHRLRDSLCSPLTVLLFSFPLKSRLVLKNSIKWLDSTLYFGVLLPQFSSLHGFFTQKTCKLVAENA